MKESPENFDIVQTVISAMFNFAKATEAVADFEVIIVM